MNMISAAHGRMEMVLVPGDFFTMGSREQALDTADEQPPHPVQIDSFYMAVYPVTQALYRALMGPEFLTYACDGHDHAPYYCASWFDAVEFCNRLSELDGLEPVYSIAGQKVTCRWKANGYRLPTEAEWEFAAGGGSTEPRLTYSGGNRLIEVGFYKTNFRGSFSQPVGMKKPNSLGLYEMSGYVWEWCWDWYDPGYYAHAPVENPKGPKTGIRRVGRGGAWAFGHREARITNREDFNPSWGGNYLGIRCARSAVHL